jgi:DNA-binding LacI/PurR family transcriptional regulator
MVMMDNYGSMLSGFEYFSSAGHTNIAYFMEDQTHVSSVEERYLAYKPVASHGSGMVDQDRWVRRFSIATPWEPYCDKIEEVVAELPSQIGTKSITAIACQLLMAAVLEACVHLGTSVRTDDGAFGEALLAIMCAADPLCHGKLELNSSGLM